MISIFGKKIDKLYGIPLSRYSELHMLFEEKGYSMKNKKEWAKIKRDFFNKKGVKK